MYQARHAHYYSGPLLIATDTVRKDMAAPPEVTIKALSGKWVMNKSLSDDPDGLFILQGLSWFTRRALGLATINLTIREYNESGKIHIDITSVAKGLSSTQEDRVLDWEDKPHQDKVFGKVLGRSRMVNLNAGGFDPQEPYDDQSKAFLQAEMLKDGKTLSTFDDKRDLLQTFAKNQDSGYGWSVEQVWGFEQVDGKRHYSRRVIGRSAKGDKIERVRLVYDYQGPLD